MNQEPDLDQLEVHMAKLSVKDEEGGNRHLSEQLPPVPTGTLTTPPRPDRTEKQVHSKPLLAT